MQIVQKISRQSNRRSDRALRRKQVDYRIRTPDFLVVACQAENLFSTPRLEKLSNLLDFFDSLLGDGLASEAVTLTGDR